MINCTARCFGKNPSVEGRILVLKYQFPWKHLEKAHTYGDGLLIKLIESKPIRQ